MTATAAIKVARREQARRVRWRSAVFGGLLVALGGILAGATGVTELIPLPTWGLGAAALFGLLLMAVSGLRLLSMRGDPKVGIAGGKTRAQVGESWVAVSRAFEGMRAGAVPILTVPVSAAEVEREALEQGNEAFQFLARRQKVVRAAIDELREELNLYHKYLTKSQVGLIGANSVAERLEDLDKRLAKIRSVV